MDNDFSVFDGSDIFDGIPISTIGDFKYVGINNLNEEQKKEIIVLLDVSLSEQYEEEYKPLMIDVYSKTTGRVDMFFNKDNEFKESPFYLAIEGRIGDLVKLIENL